MREAGGFADHGSEYCDAEASTAPGGTITSAGGAPLEHLWIEVREVMSGPPKDLE